MGFLFLVTQSELQRATNKIDGNTKKIDSNEKNIKALKDDLQRLKGTLSNFATTEELVKNFRSLQNEWREDLQDALKKISAEQKDFRDSISKIGELEEKISTLPANSDFVGLQSKLNIFQTTLEKQRTDFDGRLKTLETRPAPTIPIVPPVSPASNLEGRIVALESERQNLLNQLAQYQNFFGQIQRNFDALNKKIEAQQKIIADFDALNKKIEAQQKIIADFDALNKKIETQQKIIAEYDALNKKIEAQQKIIADFDARIKNLERKISTPTPPPIIPLTIRDFQIQKKNSVLFDNAANFEKSLAVIENLSGITSFLENAPVDKKESFNRIIKVYRQNLGKFIEKIRRKKFDADNFSEEVSEKFFDVLKKYFLAAIPVAIYRGRKENPKFYKDFLAKINEYLAACHVYSELVEPKKPITSNQIELMNIVKKDTSLRGEDKIIDEVEQLPYLLDYLSEGGDVERYCSEGKLILFKFSEGKK